MRANHSCHNRQQFLRMAAGTRRIARSPSPNGGVACSRCPCAVLWPHSPCSGVPEAVRRRATAGRAGQTPATGLTRRRPLASAPEFLSAPSRSTRFCVRFELASPTSRFMQCPDFLVARSAAGSKTRTKTHGSTHKGWLVCRVNCVAAGKRSARRAQPYPGAPNI
jgi:hypothetical protein